MLPEIIGCKLLLFYLVAVNAICLGLFLIDKKRAQAGRYRIRESVLFLWSIAGGAAGGWLGMYLFRHKTRKLKFKYGFPLLVFAQLIIIYYIIAA